MRLLMICINQQRKQGLFVDFCVLNQLALSGNVSCKTNFVHQTFSHLFYFPFFCLSLPSLLAPSSLPLWPAVSDADGKGTRWSLMTNGPFDALRHLGRGTVEVQDHSHRLGRGFLNCGVLSLLFLLTDSPV